MRDLYIGRLAYVLLRSMRVTVCGRIHRADLGSSSGIIDEYIESGSSFVLKEVIRAC